jgi:hypothetical protein
MPALVRFTNQAGTRAEHTQQLDSMADFVGSAACPAKQSRKGQDHDRGKH